MRRKIRTFCARLGTAAACLSMLTFGLPQWSYATTITLDTTLGLINGSPTGTINGVTVSFVGTVGGVADFQVYGDLDLNPGDVINATGSNAAELMVGNNVNIAGGAQVNLSASGTTAGPGGGGAGGAGSGGGGSGSGGSGGAGDGNVGANGATR